MSRFAIPLLGLLCACQTAIELPEGNSVGSLDRWDAALKEIVTPEGRVNMAALRANKQPLYDYLTYVDETEYPVHHWPRVVASLNAFNATVLHTLLERDAPPMLLDAGPRAHPDGSWYGWRTIGVGIDEVSLWELEHERLRTKPQEYRVHAAIWRGTRSSPPLRNELYRTGTIKAQLDDQMARWLQRDDGASIDQGRAVLPYEFQAYSHDFEFWSGGLNPCAVVAPYVAPEHVDAWIDLAKKGCPRRFRKHDLTTAVIR